MKSNELRIGNWIMAGEPVRVSRVELERIGGEDDSMIMGIDDYNPIPLTPEILEKSGFKRMYSDWRWKGIFNIYYDANEEVWECIIEESYASKATVTIKYLHQLQNLYFALTNKELIINL